MTLTSDSIDRCGKDTQQTTFDELERAHIYLRKFGARAKSINWRMRAYTLKHYIEDFFDVQQTAGTYVSETALIEAAKRLGYQLQQRGRDSYFDLKLMPGWNAAYLAQIGTLARKHYCSPQDLGAQNLLSRPDANQVAECRRWLSLHTKPQKRCNRFNCAVQLARLVEADCGARIGSVAIEEAARQLGYNTWADKAARYFDLKLLL